MPKSVKNNLNRNLNLIFLMPKSVKNNLKANFSMKIYFDHEKLDAYKKALLFAIWCEEKLERIPKSAAVRG
jgi:hypothetical protein